MIKKKFLITIIILLSLGCSKRYDEDPFTVRFFSLKKRLIGEWHMNKILIDGKDFSHLIEMENDTFYAIYKFSDFSKNLYAVKGKMEIKTINEKYFYNQSGNDLFFYLYPEDKYEYIRFLQKKPPSITINNYGIINDFNNNDPYLAWLINKLTIKKMHISANYQNVKYEIFFKKK